MHIKTYQNCLPEESMQVRTTVFIDEQGFRDEFDAVDQYATHLIAFDGDKAIGVCRVFWDEKHGRYTLGRLAVLKEYRGQSIGKALMLAAEEAVRTLGGNALYLHAQCRATGFYEACGYHPFGDIEPEEGCPHIWMTKQV